MGALLSCKLHQGDIGKWYLHKMVAANSPINLSTIIDSTILIIFFFLYQIWHSQKSQEVYDLLFSCMPLTAVVLSDGLVNRQGWICLGGSTCHMYHPTPTMIVMVVLLCLPGIRYVCTASESDKRDSERGVRAPGEHRGHWWCWASDRKAEIQGWSHQIAQQDSNTLQMIHKSFNILIEAYHYINNSYTIKDVYLRLECNLQWMYNHAFIERSTCIASSWSFCLAALSLHAIMNGWLCPIG